MIRWEHTLVADGALKASEVSAIRASAEEIVERGDGKVLKTRSWRPKAVTAAGVRQRRLYYLKLEIDASEGVMDQLERQAELNEDVINHITMAIPMEASSEAKVPEASKRKSPASKAAAIETLEEPSHRATQGAITGAAFGAVAGLAIPLFGPVLGTLIGAGLGLASGAISNRLAD